MTGNIAHASDFTLDVGGDITLDAAGNDIKFFNDGTQMGQIEMAASSSFNFRSIEQDADILFKGNDGGSTITALTLDMSDAGAATFNGKITADAGIDIDNINIDGTTMSLSSGSLTLDVASAIKLDADGGEIQFLDGGTEIGVVSMGSSNMNIESKVADKDIVFKGIDGSSDLTALTIDMSDAGAALFNGNIALAGGADRRIQLSNSGTSGVDFSSNNTCHIRGDNDFIKLNAAGNGGIIFEINGSEAMRVTPDRHFTVTNTANVSSWYNGTSGVGFGYSPDGYGAVVRSGLAQAWYVSTTSQGSGGFIEFSQNGANRGVISYNGSVMVYGGTSDYRLKENVTPMENALTRISALNPVNFDWIESGENSEGFLAHELQEVLPYTVTGIKDEVYTDDNSGPEKVNGEPNYQNVDYGKLTPLLVKAIQEQQEQIETLKQEVEELKGG
jgi:hypothetical protein